MRNEKDIEKKWYVSKNFNVKGDVEKVQYFMDFDAEKNEYFNLGMRDNMVIARNNQTGLPLNRTTITQLIKDNEVYQSETRVENFNKSKAIEFNQESRKNLVGIASEYLVNDLISEFGELDGIQKAKGFLDSVIPQRDKYILGIIDELIDSIRQSVFEFMTTTRKNKLVEILNVAY